MFTTPDTPMNKLLLILLLAFSVIAPSLPLVAADASNQGGTDFYVGQATVTTTATNVLPATAAFPAQRGWIIRNMDATNPIYIGRDATDSSSTGFIIKPGESLTLGSQHSIWMISTGGSVTICWLAPVK